jgi:FtsP/CotA-like multicopper oxidase with cupredoxin domain
MYPGEVQRWRLVNASAGTFMSLRLHRHAFHVLAWDGLTLPATERHEVVMLSPGNRVDLLVRAGQPGAYELVLTPGSSEHPHIPGMPAAGTAPPAAGAARRTPGFPPLPGALARRAVMTVEVSGHGPRMSLPDALPAYDPPVLPVARNRAVAFTMAQGAGGLMRLGIDGVPYDPARRPYRPVLGTAEQWTLRNDVDPRLGRRAHVFHVHTNPFRITKRNGRALSRPQWRDTAVLTSGPGDSITFETSFLDYPGRLAEHSGLAPYDDLGMMSDIEIVRR